MPPISIISTLGYLVSSIATKGLIVKNVAFKLSGRRFTSSIIEVPPPVKITIPSLIKGMVFLLMMIFASLAYTSLSLKED
ncbi:hypothetical protein D3C87_1372500 [compost metagenome]